MIWRPEVIAVIQHEAFAVVVCAEAGHDPLRATGLLLTHLPSVRKRFDSRRPQLWILKATEVRPDRCFAAQQAGLRARGIRLDDYVIGPGGTRAAHALTNRESPLLTSGRVATAPLAQSARS